MDGKVVGINTAIYSRSGGSLGIGFAIPSEMVATIISAEKSGEKNISAIRPWLGLAGQSLTRDIADSLNMKHLKGVLVSSIHPDSPVRKVGVMVGDVIKSINGQEISNMAELKFRLATISLGQLVKLEVFRKGKIIFYDIETIVPPEKPGRQETLLEGRHPLRGAKVGNLSPRVASELGVDDTKTGIVVLEIMPGSRARQVLSSGDIIIAVNDREVRNVNDLKEVLDQAENNKIFSFVIEHNGSKRRVLVR